LILVRFAHGTFRPNPPPCDSVRFANTAAADRSKASGPPEKADRTPWGTSASEPNSYFRSCLLPRRHGKYSASPIPCGSPEEYVRIESAVRLGFLTPAPTLRRLGTNAAFRTSAGDSAVLTRSAN